MERQLKRKPLGPAPIASFEDPNAEPSRMDTSGAADAHQQRLANIRERSTPTSMMSSSTSSSIAVATNTTTTTTATSSRAPPHHHGAAATSSTTGTKLRVHATSTPRIDISRASSSSHHEDSRDSSPENVFEQVGTGTLQDGDGDGGAAGATARGLGFGEDGAVELRSSTEELYFMDPADVRQGAAAASAERPKSSAAVSSGAAVVVRKSPIMFKFDELQACLQQNARKDSASSEVAALLCISGRTSRISSVGSQGSAVSRLSAVSAVSAVSRSPSPHRMLMETSFCGPKPLENSAMTAMLMAGPVDGGKSTEILEQALLARKRDSTQAIVADAIRPDATASTAAQPTSNGTPDKPIRKATTHLSANPNNTHKPTGGSRSPTVSRSANASPSTIIGVSPAGTDYIRINLKPDHLYTDKGVAPNERVIDDPAALPAVLPFGAKKPPGTLSLSDAAARPKQGGKHFADPDAISKHPQQQPSSQQRLNPSPKPTRHIALRDAGSRSPSPSTLIGAAVSRKNSLCSLFRGGGGGAKEAASPESPATAQGRDRSRSKSRESEAAAGGGSTASLASSKQNPIMAIFKPRGTPTGAKSKQSSPIDPEAAHVHSHAMATQQPQPHPQPPRPKSRLRYYDAPADGKSIHIPLHTPPEEREDAALCTVEVIKERRQQSDFRLQRPDRNGAITTASGTGAAAATGRTESVQVHQASPAGGKSARGTARHVPPPHVPDADGSVRIPLRSPTAKDAPDEPSWGGGGGAVKRGAAERSGTAIISTQAPSQAVASATTVSTQSLRHTMPVAAQPNGSAGVTSAATIVAVSKQPTPAANGQAVQHMSTFKPKPPPSTAASSPAVHHPHVIPIGQRPVPPTPISSQAAAAAAIALARQQQHQQQQQQQHPETPKPQPQSETNVAGAESTSNTITTTATFTSTTSSAAVSAAVHSGMTSKERKRILFTTKIGSGSEEQLFATQLSLSKTESLCSQLSEQASLLDSPNGSSVSPAIVDTAQQQPAPPRLSDSEAKLFEDAPMSVTMRVRDSIEGNQRRPLKSKAAQDLAASGSNNIRHSRYIENIDAILDKQKQLEEQQQQQQQQQQQEQQRKEQLQRDAADDTAQPPAPSTPKPPMQPQSSGEEGPPFDHSESVATVRRTVAREPSIRDDSATAAVEPSDTAIADRSSRTLSALGGSSESERDSELDPSASMRQHLAPAQRHAAAAAAEEESTGLVVAQEASFDDELPYIPTTLPEERSHLVSLVPVRERATMEVKTCPVDRPRSTTPLNPSSLDAYCGAAAAAAASGPSPFDDVGGPFGTNSDFGGATGGANGGAAASEGPFARGEKLRISLPRKNSRDRCVASGSGGASGSNGASGGGPPTGGSQPSKSPRRTSNASGRSWFEFAEQGLGGGAAGGGTPTSATAPPAAGDQLRRPSDASPPPPLPPRKPPHNVSQWINFENIPEKRKPPKRITTLPSKDPSVGGGGSCAMAERRQGRDAGASGSGMGGGGPSGSGMGGGGPSGSGVSGASGSGISSGGASGSGMSGGVSGSGMSARASGSSTISGGASGGSRSFGGGGGSSTAPHYSYVNPDECQCECHESERDSMSYESARMAAARNAAARRQRAPPPADEGGRRLQQAAGSAAAPDAPASAAAAAAAAAAVARAADRSPEGGAEGGAVGGDNGGESSSDGAKTEHISRRKT